MPSKLHPTQTPEYWDLLARDERLLAAQKRSSRFGTVESIRTHETNAADYEATAARLRNNPHPSTP